jgi:hypothetical protein
MTTVIVGAGIAGLYAAYKLSAHTTDIKIIEKSDRYGGRIYTYKNKYDVGAGRLGKKQKLVMKLIKDFNLEHLIIDIDPNKNYFVDEKMLTEEGLLKHYNSDYKSLKDLWLYVINYKSTLDLRQFNFHNYLGSFLKTKEIKVLERSLGYINEMYKLNAYNALYSLKKDFDVEDNAFFMLDGGLHILSKSIYDYLKTKNINVEFNTALQDIKDDYILTDKNQHIKYKTLYLAVCKKAYVTVPYFKPYYHLFDSVSVGNLLRIYAKYDLTLNKWLQNIKKTVTDNKLQFIIPIRGDLIQISYSDDYIANFWNALSVKETKKQLTRLVKEMYPNENVTEPLWITKHYWCCGSHFWKPNVNSKDVQKQINDINDNIKIVGEIYSSRQAWIEGALESVEKTMK